MLPSRAIGNVLLPS